jgi:hypothetical protein
MEIKLIPLHCEQIAEDILSGKLPPETNSFDALECLYHLDPALTMYRYDRKYGKLRRVNYSHEDIEVLIDQRLRLLHHLPGENLESLEDTKERLRPLINEVLSKRKQQAKNKESML